MINAHHRKKLVKTLLRREEADLEGQYQEKYTLLREGNMQRDAIKQKMGITGFAGIVSFLCTGSVIPAFIRIPMQIVAIGALGVELYLGKKLHDVNVIQRRTADEMTYLQGMKYGTTTGKTMTQMELDSAQAEKARLEPRFEEWKRAKATKEIKDMTQLDPPGSHVIEEQDEQINIGGVRLKHHSLIHQFPDLFKKKDSEK